jgi:hypothetical protein
MINFVDGEFGNILTLFLRKPTRINCASLTSKENLRGALTR